MTTPSSDKRNPNQPSVDRVLIVDDNRQMLNLVAKMISHLGYQPTIAESGSSALSSIAQHHYPVLLTDFNMPEMNGYELATHVKKGSMGTRVILMTGYSLDALAGNIDGFGIFDGLLAKPFDLKTLEATLHNAGHHRTASFYFDSIADAICEDHTAVYLKR